MKRRTLSRSLAVVALLAASMVSLTGVRPAQAGSPQVPERAGWKAGSSTAAHVGRAARLGGSDGIARQYEAGGGGYTIAQLGKIGDPAPRGGNHIIEYELQDLSNNGEVLFETEVSNPAGDFLGEGVYLKSGTTETEILRPGDIAPGGKPFGGFGIFSYGGISGGGRHSAFAYGTEPTDWSKPFGWDAEVVRWDRNTGAFTGIVVPHVTNAPGGGKFHGSMFNTSVNNRGDVAFAGLIETAAGRGGEGYGMGIFRADTAGDIINVASPGDAIPAGGVFDGLWDQRINDRGDITFGGHEVDEDDGCWTGSLTCTDNTYIRRAGRGSGGLGPIEVIARRGDPAPGGGTFNWAWGGRINNRGDVVYIGWLDAAVGVFVNRNGVNSAVARTQDAAPGGGHYFNFGCNQGNYGIADDGKIAFGAVLDTDNDYDTWEGTGMFVSGGPGGVVQVARTGTVLPGIGTVASVGYDAPCAAGTGGLINNRGQVLFMAILTNGDQVMLLATP